VGLRDVQKECFPNYAVLKDLFRHTPHVAFRHLVAAELIDPSHFV
jgi:hypothetical protein